MRHHALPLFSSFLLVACQAAPAPTPSRDSDLRPQFAAFGLAPRGQGPRPTCSIFTTVAAFEFALARTTGNPVRLSVDYANWAANAATGRGDDGDFFACALAGWERFGLCRDDLLPYAATFPGMAPPPPDALVDGGKRLAADGSKVKVRWIRPPDGKPGLTDAQFDDVTATLQRGWPIAAGSGHSRILVGYRADGDGTFLTLDSALATFAEVPAAYVRGELFDVFVVEASTP